MKKSYTLTMAALAMVVSSTTLHAQVNSLTVVVPEVYIAAPGPNQTDPNLLTWELYDNFSGPSLNTSFWQIDSAQQTLTTGGGGLTFTPTPLYGPGHSNVSIRATFPINLGDFFAVRVPFLITTAVAQNNNSVVDFNINLCGPSYLCDSIGWAMGNNVVPPGESTPFSGQGFFNGTDGSVFAMQPTFASQGELAMIYSGGYITNYVNEGSGWQQLGGSFFPPPEWTPGSVPLLFNISAVMDVYNPQIPQVPEPPVYALLGLGLAWLGFMRRRQV